MKHGSSTHKIHNKNQFTSEPTVLLESREDKDYVEYGLNPISTSISTQQGLIPESKNDIMVWHLSSYIQEPKEYILHEYPSIQTTIETKDDQVSIQQAVRGWSDSTVNSANYEEERAEYLEATNNNQEPYCTSLLTCSCGYREPFNSVSLAISERDQNHMNHESRVWLYSGRITDDVVETSMKKYHVILQENKTILSRILNRSDDRPPIYKVPIYSTPLSLALQEIDAYDTSDHSTDDYPIKMSSSDQSEE